jgi:hypothetical protein
MYRLVMLILAATVALGAVLSPVAAQEAATPAADERLDLAAITLTPSELAGLDLPGYGLANQSSLRDAESDALVQADGDPLEAARRLAMYQEQGFQVRYLGSLLRPVLPLDYLPSGLVAAESRISTAITVFSTAEGAAAAFVFNEGELDDAPGDDVAGTRMFGDESELTRSTGTEVETGEPLQRLELTIRLDNLIVEAIIVDYQNVEPEIATVERLGEALLLKLAANRARALPGLSNHVLRLTPMASWIQEARLRDFYVRLDQTTEPTFAEIVAAARQGEVLEAQPGDVSDGVVAPMHTYLFWTPIGEGDPLSLPLYVVWLDQYQSPQQAAAAIAGQSDDLGAGYVDVQEFFAGETIGDQSRAFGYTYQGDSTGTVRGDLVLTRVGDVVIRTQVDGPEGVKADGVHDLARAQVACLEAGGPCPPLSALQVLANLVVGLETSD